MRAGSFAWVIGGTVGAALGAPSAAKVARDRQETAKTMRQLGMAAKAVLDVADRACKRANAIPAPRGSGRILAIIVATPIAIAVTATCWISLIAQI